VRRTAAIRLSRGGDGHAEVVHGQNGRVNASTNDPLVVSAPELDLSVLHNGPSGDCFANDRFPSVPIRDLRLYPRLLVGRSV
jgi:hypothetical protein